MLRFSPRQVKLAPGERQIVKLSLRRPRDLAPGEYRSHLRFRALPPEPTDDDGNATSMKINMVVNFSVPITVQQGAYDVSVSLNKANIAFNPSNEQVELSLDLQRTGAHSSSGDLAAYWTPNGGKEVLLAKRADYNFWTELTSASPTLVWTGESFTPSDGQLRIVYEGVRDFKGTTYLEETVAIKRTEITLLQ